jgi:hypothetical protein
MGSHSKNGACGAGIGGGLWYIGWLFTIAYAKLTFWKAVWALVVWPYYLGVAVR